jgi:hypothetical protein
MSNLPLLTCHTVFIRGLSCPPSVQISLTTNFLSPLVYSSKRKKSFISSEGFAAHTVKGADIKCYQITMSTCTVAILEILN